MENQQKKQRKVWRSTNRSKQGIKVKCIQIFCDHGLTTGANYPPIFKVRPSKTPPSFEKLQCDLSIFRVLQS